MSEDDPFEEFDPPEDEDPFEAFEAVEAFEPADVDGIDPDAIWDDLTTADDEEAPTIEEDVYDDVSKHTFCEQCEYFSRPPDVGCTYEGAAIVEFLDMETVRLLNCPIVAEKRELEESGLAFEVE